jgi:hypothetical protein
MVQASLAFMHPRDQAARAIRAKSYRDIEIGAGSGNLNL